MCSSDLLADADDNGQPASAAAGAALEQAEAGHMKRGVGEQTILAGATWQLRRAQPGRQAEQ